MGECSCRQRWLTGAVLTIVVTESSGTPSSISEFSARLLSS